VPELLQQSCTPAALAAALDPLIGEGPRRSAQRDVLARVVARLRDVSEPPSQAAARVVLDAIKGRA
jgi:lipid-A-disaccharide synthase